jgi:two-component system NtrC family response regulator
VRLLVVDDEKRVCELVSAICAGAGYAVTATHSGQEFLEAFDRVAPDACVLDMMLPDTDGLKLLAKVHERVPEMPVVMLTAMDTAADATAALRAGAFDYMVKPVDAERLVASIGNAIKSAGQARELRSLRSQLRDHYSFDTIAGSSARLAAVKAEARKVAGSSATVLVHGESGTGKELFARAIHYAGSRAKGPFIDVNCAALTETLLESEIFGHEKGAFTGAVARRIGKFEQADGGTIFLDEIGDMPAPTQAKLLRVLQERSFQRVGGSERVTVDVRVISATNQPLEKRVEEGAFRQDLLYRINTVTIEIPSLRERLEDVPELARHFVAAAARAEGRRVPELAEATARVLREYRWPGNVRELENAMRRAVVLCEGARIEPSHLPPQVARVEGAAGPATPAGEPAEGNMLKAVEALERRMIVDALTKSGWVKARAARMLGVTERILSYKIDGYGIARDMPG